jgi:hypothetical protein
MKNNKTVYDDIGTLFYVQVQRHGKKSSFANSTFDSLKGLGHEIIIVFK